jgi:hypothetical protein
MKPMTARSAWHDAFYTPAASGLSFAIDNAMLGASIQRSERDSRTHRAADQVMCAYIQRAIGTLPYSLKCFGNWMYSPIACDDDKDEAEEAVFLLACRSAGRMTAKSLERAEYVAKGVLHRYRRMHQGGQSSCADPLASPEGFRKWLLDWHGLEMPSSAWERDWEPFVQACFDACNDLDKEALKPVSAVVGEMLKEAA